MQCMCKETEHFLKLVFMYKKIEFYYNVVTQLGANITIILGVLVNLFTTFLCITFHSSRRFQIALE